MEAQNVSVFDDHEVLHDLKHYLPAQAPLKDFIHHNTLHAFQKRKFHEAMRDASAIFGYKSTLSLEEFRSLYHNQRISHVILDQIISEKKGPGALEAWKKKLISENYDNPSSPRIGKLRSNWKRIYQIDLDALVHPLLFRLLCSYLDQGISMWNFPVHHKGFLFSIRELERNSFTSLFRTERVRNILLNGDSSLETLLTQLIGDETLFKQYLFDQQFAHQGWSGMVSTIEDWPETLLDKKKISLHELVVFELLLEIDALDFSFGTDWTPLGDSLIYKPLPLFDEVPFTEQNEVLAIWQEAFEWTYYDRVLAGISSITKENKSKPGRTFQAMFCIDDRECSIRRYLEKFDPDCETFGTAGFFGVEFYFKPDHGKFYTKLCPAPVIPKYLIKEQNTKSDREKDLHFSKRTHGLFSGWIISQTFGFWSALKLMINIFRPSMGPATASSFRHMDHLSHLTIENTSLDDKENELQVGFTIEEMANRVEALLKSIGLVNHFAPIVYVVGHGSSSVNNPHYAAYDCGACSGRPGSVNARVLCHMANHPEVRNLLREKGIDIPKTTRFVGALHDTTRDEIAFFDLNKLTPKHLAAHHNNERVFNTALDSNAKERSRRFESINSKLNPQKIHELIKTRSVSLFEPRPELNHATNALCVVGRRSITKGVFLDRRSFMNSFDYRVDPQGNYLLGILKAVAPVCGGINLEYYFSRVDNQKLGAGTKLPHNVMGLFGVANGIDGDLRPGLPSQMIEVHDPVRLLVIVEHYPDVVLATLRKSPETYEWFLNEWIHLVAEHPDTQQLYYFKDGAFTIYTPLSQEIDTISDIASLMESNQENIPAYLISQV